LAGVRDGMGAALIERAGAIVNGRSGSCGRL
jgi:hypothetical protein